MEKELIKGIAIIKYWSTVKTKLFVAEILCTICLDHIVVTKHCLHVNVVTFVLQECHDMYALYTIHIVVHYLFYVIFYNYILLVKMA